MPRSELGMLRLAAQGVGEPGGSPHDVARRLLAVQAQDLPGALWSLGLRSGAGRAELEDELATGRLVRSWPMRGTLHVVPVEDLRWVSALTRERTVASWAGRRRQLDLTESDLARATAVCRERLTGGVVPRRELLAAFAEAGVSTEGQRGANLLVWLAQEGVILIRRGGDFALADEHLPPEDDRDRAIALGHLAGRYFTGHGPATVRDLAWWAGLTLADARLGAERAREELDERVVDGVVHLSGPGLDAEAGSGVHALPGFDEFVLGYADRSAALGDSPLERVVPGRNGMFLPTIVIDGTIAATWRRDTRGSRVRVELDPWRSLAARRRPAVRRRLRAWADFSGLELDLVDRDR